MPRKSRGRHQSVWRTALGCPLVLQGLVLLSPSPANKRRVVAQTYCRDWLCVWYSDANCTNPVSSDPFKVEVNAMRLFEACAEYSSDVCSPANASVCNRMAVEPTTTEGRRNLCDNPVVTVKDCDIVYRFGGVDVSVLATLEWNAHRDICIAFTNATSRGVIQAIQCTHGPQCSFGNENMTCTSRAGRFQAFPNAGVATVVVLILVVVVLA